MAHELSTCTFCGVGCGLYLEKSANKVVGVYPSISHPTNKGRLCVRGWHVHEVASSPDRLKKPLVKKNGKFVETTLDDALGFIVTRLETIKDKYGPDSIAMLSSPRCSNEETYLLQKLARSVIGTNNVDHGAGVYCNNSIEVLLDMIGVPATTNSVSELAQSEVIIVDGVDLARRVPTIGGMVLRAKLHGAKLVVIGARRHRIAESADLFLQPQPGTETSLHGAMAKIIIDRGLMNLPFIKSRCLGYEEFLEKAGGYDLLTTAQQCGVPAELIEEAAVSYARAKSAAILYSTGVEARDAESIQSMVNLALLTGQIGREGAGIFALAEHNNSQGVCDMGMMPDRLPGYSVVESDAARAEFETVWKAKVPKERGRDAGCLFTTDCKDKIKAVWLCRYDPVSTASYGDAAGLLEQSELVVMQHVLMAETARYADVILPTTAFGEERVTFTSTERRIQLAERVVDPPEGILPAWQQITKVARALGADWEYGSSSDVMDEIGRVVPFYSGANYENLARQYGRQWPCTKEHPLGTPMLLSDAVQDLKFVPLERKAPAADQKEYPFTLIFGHSLYYWNQNVLIQHSETLKREYRMLILDYPNGFVEINTEDAKQLGIRDGQRIRLRAATGSAVIAAKVTPEVRIGTAYVPFFVRQVQQILGSQERGATLVPVSVEKEVA
jgi:formate dehydrogenase major subunit